jgi:hypothetical protein
MMYEYLVVPIEIIWKTLDSLKLGVALNKA